MTARLRGTAATRSSRRASRRRGSRLFLPGHAIALRADHAFNDLAAVAGNELSAVAALLVSAGVILILHGLLGGFCRQRFLASEYRRRQSCADDQRGVLQDRAPRHFPMVIHAYISFATTAQ